MLKRLAKKYDYNGNIDSDNIDEVQARLKEADHAHNQFRPRAHEFHETYLGNLV